MPAQPPGPTRRHTGRGRWVCLALAVFIGALTAVYFPFGTKPAHAAEPCDVKEWQTKSFQECVNRLKDLTQDRIECVKAPTPEDPDSGLAGWFAAQPPSSNVSSQANKYSKYGYAGYDFTTYDIGCAQTVMHPDYKFENTVANGELMFATAIIGASNALREHAWEPQNMWGWADPLVDSSTKAIYKKVFTVFGAVTLCVVGLYLIWRSRQSDMNNALTTAGWALFVMIFVTAVASWPSWSASLADKTLVTGLSVIHDAIGPPSETIPPDQCRNPNPDACRDLRSPAVRASDMATDTLLYRNWLRGTLGSADSLTAQKYGPALYDAKSITWAQAAQLRPKDDSPGERKRVADARKALIDEKNKQWEKIAEQIKTEDPAAYEYLQGVKGMDRIGSGFIAVLSALFFALFDMVASLLVLLGFLIFRWAVIAAPILGTVALLRPASAGFKRLINAVVAALFNIIIFGTGAAIYLFAVDLIMSTPTLAGWLQVVLIWLVGVVGWLLLRPYRRITQLGGKDHTSAFTSIGSWHKKFFSDLRDTASLSVARPGGTTEPADSKKRREVTDGSSRTETRGEDPTVETTRKETAVRPEDRRTVEEREAVGDRGPDVAGPRPVVQERRVTYREVAEYSGYEDHSPAGVAVYRPDSVREADESADKERRAAERLEAAARDMGTAARQLERAASKTDNRGF